MMIHASSLGEARKATPTARGLGGCEAAEQFDPELIESIEVWLYNDDSNGNNGLPPMLGQLAAEYKSL